MCPVGERVCKRDRMGENTLGDVSEEFQNMKNKKEILKRKLKNLTC